MARVNEFGYVEVKSLSKKSPGAEGIYRNFWIGRQKIGFKQIYIPEKFWGKRIRFKIEEIE